VKNVLEQYSKDGLAFQRYGRVKQDGLGDDILSGNSLTIVGLYQAIYGINPLYNRFYLDPHITPELAGTVLNYNFRGSKLVITLDSNSYSVADKSFKVTANKAFGFNATKNRLSYFNDNNADVSLQATSTGQVSIDIKNWGQDKIEWQQHTVRPVVYVLYQLTPNSNYRLILNGVKGRNIKSNPNGEITINTDPASGNKMITLTKL